MFIINTTSCVINTISIFYILFWSCAADMTVEGTKEDDWGLQRSVLFFFSFFGGEKLAALLFQSLLYLVDKIKRGFCTNKRLTWKITSLSNLDSRTLILALAELECFFAQMWILASITQMSCLEKDWFHQVNSKSFNALMGQGVFYPDRPETNFKTNIV